jgi:cell division septation protein DedD
LVNVGLFADENNARNASAKLEDARIPVLVNEMDTAKGKRTRVRAGPFATQAEAERAADKIQFIGLDAVVVRK